MAKQFGRPWEAPDCSDAKEVSNIDAEEAWWVEWDIKMRSNNVTSDEANGPDSKDIKVEKPIISEGTNEPWHNCIMGTKEAGENKGPDRSREPLAKWNSLEENPFEQSRTVKNTITDKVNGDSAGA